MATLPQVQGAVRKPSLEQGPGRDSAEQKVAFEPSPPPPTEPKSDDVRTRALTLSRKHRLEFWEVKDILEALKETPREDQEGGICLEHFREFMCKAFNVSDIEGRVVMDAFRESAFSQSPIDVNNFIEWYKKNIFTEVAALRTESDVQRSNALVKGLSRRHGVAEMDVDKIKSAFDKFDSNKSGEIDRNEFASMMKQLLGVSQTADLPRARLDKFWNEIDADGSGCVEFQEFTAWYIKYFVGEDSRGLVEAFYSSYMPSSQRKNSVDPDPIRAREELYGTRQPPSSEGFSGDDADFLNVVRGFTRHSSVQ